MLGSKHTGTLSYRTASLVSRGYHLSWPARDWHLRGVYKEVQPGRRLVFTWKWDHDGMPERTVEISLQPQEDGSALLALSQGLYGTTEEDQKDRADHLEGWQYFLGQLQSQEPVP